MNVSSLCIMLSISVCVLMFVHVCVWDKKTCKIHFYTVSYSHRSKFKLFDKTLPHENIEIVKIDCIKLANEHTSTCTHTTL